MTTFKITPTEHLQGWLLTILEKLLSEGSRIISGPNHREYRNSIEFKIETTPENSLDVQFLHQNLLGREYDAIKFTLDGQEGVIVKIDLDNKDCLVFYGVITHIEVTLSAAELFPSTSPTSISDAMKRWTKSVYKGPSMKRYYGTKQVKALPMTLGEYNTYRGWNIPPQEDPDTAGYLVEYTDGGKPNHPKHVGYISWSPATVFEGSYKTSGDLSWGHALEVLKSGGAVARKGWNGKDMFVYLVGPNRYKAVTGVAKAYFGEEAEVPYSAYFAIKNVDGTVSTWVPAVNDNLANDWYAVAADAVQRIGLEVKLHYTDDPSETIEKISQTTTKDADKP